VHAQTLLVEAALSKVRSMQNDMSNLSLDVLVTLKHDLSGVCRVARGGCRCSESPPCSHQLRGSKHVDDGMQPLTPASSHTTHMTRAGERSPGH
jgi:hypothetical protein